MPVRRIVEESSQADIRLSEDLPIPLTDVFEPLGGRGKFIEMMEDITKIKFTVIKEDLIKELQDGLERNRATQKPFQLQKVQDIISIIQKDQSQGEIKTYNTNILKIVLKAYTEDTFIYQEINSSLRILLWDKIKLWANFIYAMHWGFCFLGDPPIPRKYIRPPENYPPLYYLYRGLSMTQESLDLYNSLDQFSWMNFVSTSYDEKVAIKFANKHLTSDKKPVVFMIWTDNPKSQFYNLQKISNFEEQETLIRPGTIFKKINYKVEENSGITYIELKTDEYIHSDRDRLEYYINNLVQQIGKGDDKIYIDGSKDYLDSDLDKIFQNLVKSNLKQLFIFNLIESNKDHIKKLIKLLHPSLPVYVLSSDYLEKFESIGQKIINDKDVNHIQVMEKLKLQYDDINSQTLDITVADFRECFAVFIKTLTGRTIKVIIKDNDTILFLKYNIYFIDGIPLVQQRLIFNGKPLEDFKRVKDYSIKKDSTIHLLLRLLGGQ